MSPEVRAGCFEPFYTTKGIGTGAGLGLTTVYGIVQQLGGTVTVKSEPGRGTAFHIHLPISDALPIPEGPKPPPRPERAPATLGTVVVVEDEPTLRRVVCTFLKRRGFEVVDLDNAEDALALALENPPDLLITDIVLPGMWGYELTERLRSSWPDLPVVQMSGYTGESRTLEPGVLFLLKPFSQANLLDKVYQIMSLRPPDPADRTHPPQAEGAPKTAGSPGD